MATMDEVLAAIGALHSDVTAMRADAAVTAAALSNRIDALSNRLDRVDAAGEQTYTEVVAARADTAQLRTEMGIRFDLTDRGTDTLRGDVDAVRSEVREGFAGIKGETALLERYVIDAQRAIRHHAEDPRAHGQDAA